MRNRQQDTNGTLTRLDHALSVLEGRIGVTTQQPMSNSQATSDLSMIRSRQAALNSNTDNYRTPPAPQGFQQPNMRANALQEEVKKIRSELEREMTGARSPGFDTLREEPRGPKSTTSSLPQGRSSSAAANELRKDISALKQDVALLAREDTLQGLVERWGVVEREIANLPQTLGSRDEMLSMADRLDNVQHAISALPQSDSLSDMEVQVRNLALAVEQMAVSSESSALSAGHMDARFEEISSAVAAIPTSASGAPTVDFDALERIENRIASLANVVEAADNSIPTAALDAKFSDIADRLGALYSETSKLRTETQSSSSHDIIAELANRIDDLGEQLKSNDVSNSTGDNDEMLTELNDRVVYIIEQLNASTSTAEETAQTLIASLDTRMDEIAQRIDANEREASSVPSINSLEARLEDIAQMLANGSAPAQQAHDQDLSNLEIQISQLAQSLSDSPASIDEDSLVSAARIAAEEAVTRLSGNVGVQGAENLHQLTDDLKALELLARDSDDRNNRTFEAIHDTLLKVVDHLSGLEDTIRTTPDAIVPRQQYSTEMRGQTPPKQAANLEPDHRSAISTYSDDEPINPRVEIDAPSISPEDHLPLDEHVSPRNRAEEFVAKSIAERKTRETRSPAAAAAAAAAAAIEETNSPTQVGVVEPVERVHEDETPQATSLLRGMASKLRRGTKANQALPDMDTAVDGPVTNDVSEAIVNSAPVVSDEPIEPGSAGADLSAIMRRVREERSGTAADGAAASGESTDDDRGKSDFIAAARRAAKAAAADATVASREGRDDRRGKGSSLGAMLSARRRPILMGAGAILLALLALPLVKGFLVSGGVPLENQAKVEDQIPAVENSATAALPEVEDPLSSENSNENTVRDVSENNTVPSSEGTFNSLEANLGAQELPAVQENPPVEVNLEDVPADVGPIALREAAANGDAKALYLVGDYFFGGVAGQSGNDLGKALTWYEKSAELGYAPAQYRVGNFYEKGFGGERDLMQAKTWYQLAAEQGNAAAMHNLAVLFANGPDGTPDVASAIRWFEKAAELGVKDSQFNLGILSAQGNGTKVDLASSYKWFAIVAKSGDGDATAKRDQVGEALGTEQLASVRDAVAQWKPKELNEDVNIVTVPDEWQTDVAQTTAAAPELSAAEMKKAVQNIQGILNNNGYDAGPVDGVMGGKTRDAIKAFQKKNGLNPSGEVNPELVTKLLEVNEKK